MSDPLFKHKVLFFAGMFCVIVSIIFIVFSLFLFPYLFFGFTYQVPQFILNMQEWYSFYYQFGDLMIAIVIFLPFVIIGLLFALAAKIVDSFMDKEATRLAKDHGLAVEKRGLNDPQNMVTVIKVLLLIAVIIAVIYLANDFLSSDKMSEIE